MMFHYIKWEAVRTHLMWTQLNMMCCGSGMSQEAVMLAETWCLYTVSFELWKL